MLWSVETRVERRREREPGEGCLRLTEQRGGVGVWAVQLLRRSRLNAPSPVHMQMHARDP